MNLDLIKQQYYRNKLLQWVTKQNKQILCTTNVQISDTIKNAFIKLDCDVTIEEQPKQFNVLWCSPVDNAFIKRLQHGQSVNSIPGHYCLFRKDNLSQTVNKFCKQFNLQLFTPHTLVLPDEKEIIQQLFENDCSDFYVLKQSCSARGEGVELVHKLDQIDLLQQSVLQKYIQNPLLINNCKFDFRVYALVASVEPFIVYFWNDGLARFAASEYQKADSDNFSKQDVHLTNYSLNKQLTQQEIKTTMTKVIEELQRENQNNVDIYAELKKVTLFTFLAAYETLFTQSLLACCNGIQSKCFGFYGLDIIPTDQFKFKLLEVNVNPSSAVEGDVDQVVKCEMYEEIAQLVCPEKQFVSVEDKDVIVSPIIADENQLGDSHDVQKKYSHTIQQYEQILKSKKQIKFVKLTPYEQQVITKFKLNQQKIKRFELLIPNTNPDFNQFYKLKQLDYLLLIYLENQILW